MEQIKVSHHNSWCTAPQVSSWISSHYKLWRMNWVSPHTHTLSASHSLVEAYLYPRLRQAKIQKFPKKIVIMATLYADHSAWKAFGGLDLVATLKEAWAHSPSTLPLSCYWIFFYALIRTLLVLNTLSLHSYVYNEWETSQNSKQALPGDNWGLDPWEWVRILSCSILSCSTCQDTRT